MPGAANGPKSEDGFTFLAHPHFISGHLNIVKPLSFEKTPDISQGSVATS